MWDKEMPLVLRHLIGDVSETSPTYTDQRLSELILVAGLQTTREVNFFQTYSIDIVSFSITPDPTVSPRDESFLWLVSLKAACMITQFELKTAARQAISIVDQGSAVDLRGSFAGAKVSHEVFCQDYKDSRWRYQMANRPAGQGIFGPFSIMTASAYGQAGGFQFYAPRDRPLFK